MDYTAGALSEATLDTDSLQAFYMAQESVDIAALSMGLDSSENWDADSKRIKNVAAPTASADAATKGYADGLVIAEGNVPTPANPGDDNKVLVASAGSFSWTSFLISMISDATSFGKAFLGLADAAAARSTLSVITTDDVSTWTAGQSGEITVIADAVTITPDFSDSNNFSVTIGGNRTLANPSNAVAGQSGVIAVTQADAGGRTLSYGSNYVFANGTEPTLTVGALATDLLFYYAISSTEIFISHAKDVKA